MGALLAKLGLTPQNPLQRAYQRDSAVIDKWQRERFPAMARQAKASGGKVYFWNLPKRTWRQVTWREGTNTPLISRFAAVRVRPAHRDYNRTNPRYIRRMVCDRMAKWRSDANQILALHAALKLMGRRAPGERHRVPDVVVAG